MKTTLVIIAILFSPAIFAQDTTKLNQINALVYLINTSDYKVQTDTIKNDQPQLGLSTRTYLTMVTTETELKKYVNDVYVKTQENGTTKEMVGNNTFYFDQNRLIKVEEFITKDGKKMEALWYFADDKPIYYTLKSDQAQGRAELLLTMAKSMIERIGFK